MRLAKRLAAILAVAAVTTGGWADPVTVRFATSSGGENLKLVNRQIREFEAEHPNIRIKAEPIADNYEQKLLAEYAANVAPDCATFNPNRIELFADKGALKPLDDFPDLNGPEVDLKGRYPNIVDALTVNRRLFALPRDVGCSAIIYYNKRLFDAAGIPYPDGSWTWDTKVRPELREKDFVWTMQRLTLKRTGDAAPYQFGFAAAWPQLWMETLLVSSNVRMWDRDDRPTRLFLTDAKVLDVFQFAADCMNRYHWIPSFNDVTLGSGSTMQNEFRLGRVAMLQSGSWEVRDMRAKMDGDWDIAPFPRFARGNTTYLPGEGSGVGIFNSSSHPREAWAWIKWYCGAPGLIPLGQSGETQPSIRALAVRPGVWLPPTGVRLKPENLAITDALALRVHNQRLPEWFQGIYDDLQSGYYGVLSGEKTAEQALSRLQSDEPAKLRLALRRVDAPPYPFAKGVAVAATIVAALLLWIYAPEWRVRRTRSERAEGRSGYLFILPWLCGLGLTVGPMIYSLLLSFADSDIIQTPKWRGLGNYADLLNPRVDDTLWVSLRQTFLFAVLSVPAGLVSALALAILLNQKVKGIPLFRALYYLPSLASAVAMSLIWMRLFDRDQGLINAFLYGSDGKSGFLHLGPLLSNWVGTPGQAINWFGNTKTVIPAFVIMGLWGAGGGTIIFLGGLQGISPSYHEAATLDGAGALRRFRSVVLPLMTPYIFFSLITGVIGALQVFGQAFVITSGGPDRATFFMVVWLYDQAFGHLKMGYASAIAWLLFVVVMAVTAIQLGLSRRWVFYEGELK
jgi:multiple sugar transport system permease protein